MSSENDLSNLPNQLKRLVAIRGEAIRYVSAKDLEREGVLFVQDGNHGNNRPRQEEFVGDSIPFVRPPDLVSGEVCFTSCDHINDKAYSRIRKGIGKPGDILITTNATIGRIAKTQQNAPETFVVNPQITLWRSTDKRVVDQKYLYCFMRDAAFMDQLWSFCGDNSTFNYVCLSLQKEIYLALPDIQEQKAIAHILGTLDDKIELNRKTNETLEAMAKALFKSWFVDFDPVRAKIEGRPTGLPSEISDLFPDSFEDSELGEIPSGWSISCVNDLCEWVSSGGTPSRSRKDFWENGNIPWFKTGELNDAPLLDSAEKINELALGNSSCKYWEAGTILFAIYASPTVGRLGVLTESGTSNQAAAGLKAKVGIGTPFLRRTLLFSRDELQNIAVGAAQQNINVQILKDHKVVAPGSSLATIYSKTISPLDEQQICLAKSTREFCLLRDALLPKLISGEIRITDAEKMLEEVGV